MNVLRSVEAIATASGDGPVDWDAVAAAAKAATDPGSIALEAGEREGYAADVREARDRVRSVSGLEFEVPATVEIQNRHHWIDANVATFGAVMAPLEDRPLFLPGVARRVNSATMGALLAFLGNHVLGQYDPLLLADGEEPALYFVRPNVRRVAAELDVEYGRFRRWIAFHEVTHAAEFGAAPWLSGYLEERLEASIEALAAGEVRPAAFREVDVAMTAVEGYAELVMDRAFDGECADIRRKVDARRRGGGPLARFVRRALGLGLKRRQYERGRAFFEAVVDADGMATASSVWDDPTALPTDGELDAPGRWLDRVGDWR